MNEAIKIDNPGNLEMVKDDLPPSPKIWEGGGGDFPKQ
jgi:hypothetical protein